MLGTFFLIMQVCASPIECSKPELIFHPVLLTYEVCKNLAQQTYDQHSDRIKVIGCKEQGTEELKFWIVRAPEL